MSEIFQLDKSSFPAREVIKVVGVGGAGNNALNHIIRGGVSGVGIYRGQHRYRPS